MRIKTTDGEENVTPQGQGTLALVLGAVGALGTLMSGGNLLGLGGGNNNNRPPRDEGDRPVTRYDMGLIRENIAAATEIAMLKGQQYTDRAMAGVQQQIAMQNTWNAVQQQNIAMMQKQLGDITKFVVPITSIDPVPTSQGTTSTSTQSNG